MQFIRASKILNHYTETGSIGKYVMDGINVEESARKNFWKLYKPIVRQSIKMKRNVVHTALRKRFIGMKFNALFVIKF